MNNKLKFAVIMTFLLLSLASVNAVSAGPYSTAMENTNPGAPDPGIPGFVGPAADGRIDGGNYVNPIFVAWASEVVDYSPANQTIQAQWTNASKALGPVTGDNFDIVSLGDLNETQILAGEKPGSITLGFDKPIVNGEGADFAVFENGFISAGGAGVTGQIFAELAYVEVSTDNITFVRFPSVSLTPNLVGGYGTIDPTNVYNLVGKHVNAYGNSWGTPFDLEDLLNTTEVLTGLVDLNNINYIRIVDIPGNGYFTDSLGNPIYDAWVTWGSGGLDLEAVGVINTLLDPVVNTRTGLTYNTIQSAIDDVSTINGDTLTVNNGSYTENVIVNKSLLLQALGLVTVSPLDESLPVFTITGEGSGSSIQGFSIWGSNRGIVLNETSNNLIQNNEIFANPNQAGEDTFGVHLVNANSNQIIENTIFTCGDTITYGVYLENSSSNVINHNVVYTTGLAGDVDWSTYPDPGIYPTIGVFFFNGSSNNTLLKNNITTDYNSVSGSDWDTILGVRICQNSSGNNLTDNIIYTEGYSYAYGLEIVGGSDSICSDTIISGNNISTVGENYANGVKVSAYTKDTLISENDISAQAANYAYGLYLENYGGLENVTATQNNITSTANENYAVELYGASNHNITYNLINSIGEEKSYGIHLMNLSNSNNISGNYVTVKGNGTTHGVYLEKSSLNLFDSNNINTTGASAPVDWSDWLNGGKYETIGFFIFDHSNSNTLSNNTINTDYDAIIGFYDTILGVRIHKGSNGNNLTGNIINTTGYSYAYGLEIVGTEQYISSNNSVLDNNISTVAIRDDETQSYANGVKLTSYSTNTLVAGNNISAVAPRFSYPVYLEDFGYGYDWYLGPSTITENNIYGSAHITYLIELWCTRYQTITNNEINGVGNYTLGIGTAFSTENTITNNTINTIGYKLAPIGYNVDYITISNEGISLQSSSNNNLVDSNVINSDDVYTINSHGSSGNIISNNYLWADNGNKLGNHAVNQGTGVDTVINNGFNTDLTVYDFELPADPVVGQTYPVNIPIANIGVNNAGEFLVYLWENEIIVGTANVSSLAAGQNTNIIFDWTPATPGTRQLQTVVDPTNMVEESNKENNISIQEINVTGFGNVKNLESGLVFNTIQEAINDAQTQNNHTLMVKTGTYTENVTVNKKLNLIADGNVTISPQDILYPVFAIFDLGSGSTISGFNITGGAAGISLIGAENCTISNNNLSDNGFGLNLFQANHNTIETNNIENNDFYGIFMDKSSNNTIESNTITGNPYAGIALYYDSDENQITENLISENGFGIYSAFCEENTIINNEITNNLFYGIFLESAINHTLESNTITGNPYAGIALYYDSDHNTLTDNQITDNGFGIYLADSHENTVTNNQINDNLFYGIFLEEATKNQIISNEIKNNPYAGIALYNNSNENSIHYNNLEENGFGVYVTDSSSNQIYQNNFRSNLSHNWDNETNHWDNGADTGNYYNDWLNTDPRAVPGGPNTDQYPQNTEFIT